MSSYSFMAAIGRNMKYRPLCMRAALQSIARFESFESERYLTRIMSSIFYFVFMLSDTLSHTRTGCCRSHLRWRCPEALSSPLAFSEAFNCLKAKAAEVSPECRKTLDGAEACAATLKDACPLDAHFVPCVARHRDSLDDACHASAFMAAVWGFVAGCDHQSSAGIAGMLYPYL
jgi:hypothetical protein